MRATLLLLPLVPLFLGCGAVRSPQVQSGTSSSNPASLKLSDWVGVYVGTGSVYVGADGWYRNAPSEIVVESQDQDGKVGLAIRGGMRSEDQRSYGFHFDGNPVEGVLHGEIRGARGPIKFKFTLDGNHMSGRLAEFDRVAKGHPVEIQEYEVHRRDLGVTSAQE